MYTIECLCCALPVRISVYCCLDVCYPDVYSSGQNMGQQLALLPWWFNLKCCCSYLAAALDDHQTAVGFVCVKAALLRISFQGHFGMQTLKFNRTTLLLRRYCVACLTTGL